jgi:hypothetical protein
MMTMMMTNAAATCLVQHAAGESSEQQVDNCPSMFTV